MVMWLAKPQVVVGGVSCLRMLIYPYKVITENLSLIYVAC